MQQVLQPFSDLPPSSDLDLIFLKGIMESPTVSTKMATVKALNTNETIVGIAMD